MEILVRFGGRIIWFWEKHLSGFFSSRTIKKARMYYSWEKLWSDHWTECSGSTGEANCSIWSWKLGRGLTDYWRLCNFKENVPVLCMDLDFPESIWYCLILLHSCSKPEGLKFTTNWKKGLGEKDLGSESSSLALAGLWVLCMWSSRLMNLDI